MIEVENNSMAEDSVSQSNSSGSRTNSRISNSQSITCKSYRVDTVSNVSCLSGFTGVNRSYYGGN